MTDEIQVPWFIDEGRAGSGPRPDWLPEKFKTAADLAKSYHDLEKRFSVAPEEYDFTKSRYIDPDYVPFQELRQIAKDKRVPKDVMDKMVDSFDKYMDEFKVDYDEEVKKLGDGARDRIKVLDNWAKANLTKESYDAISSSMNNAESIKALEELRGKFMSNTPQVPTGNSGSVENTQSIDDLKLEMTENLEKYKTDTAYRKDWQRRMELAAKAGNHGYVDKIGA